MTGHGDEAELPLELRWHESGGGGQAGAGPQLSAGGGVRAAPGGPPPARGSHPHPGGHHRGQHRSLNTWILRFKNKFWRRRFAVEHNGDHAALPVRHILRDIGALKCDILCLFLVQ